MAKGRKISMTPKLKNQIEFDGLSIRVQHINSRYRVRVLDHDTLPRFMARLRQIFKVEDTAGFLETDAKKQVLVPCLSKQIDK